MSLCLYNSVETLAVARNIEEPAAARIIPIIPAKVLQPISREILTSKVASAASAVGFNVFYNYIVEKQYILYL